MSLTVNKVPFEGRPVGWVLKHAVFLEACGKTLPREVWIKYRRGDDDGADNPDNFGY